MPALALATGTNTSYLDRLYKTNQQMETYIFSGLQLGKQLDSWEDIVRVVIMEVVDSDFDFSHSHVFQWKLRASKRPFCTVIDLALILAMWSNRMHAMNAHAQ